MSAAADLASPYTVTVVALDSVNSSVGASQTFAWPVSYGVAVTLVNPGDQANAVGDTVMLPQWGIDSVGNSLTYSASGLPAGLTINATTGVILGTMASGAQTGSPYSVTVTATDSVNDSVSASRTFQWTVAASGTVTVSLTNPGSQTNEDGDTVSPLTISAVDSASNTLTYSAGNLPPGLIINPATGVISGTVDAGAHLSSPYLVTLSARDSVNTSVGASTTFTWTVNENPSITYVSLTLATSTGLTLEELEDIADAMISQAATNCASYYTQIITAEVAILNLGGQLQTAKTNLRNGINNQATFQTGLQQYQTVYSTFQDRQLDIWQAISNIEAQLEGALVCIEALVDLGLPSEDADYYVQELTFAAVVEFWDMKSADGFMRSWVSAGQAFWTGINQTAMQNGPVPNWVSDGVQLWQRNLSAAAQNINTQQQAQAQWLNGE